MIVGDNKFGEDNKSFDNPNSNESNDAPINVVDTDDEMGEDNNTLKEKENNSKLKNGPTTFKSSASTNTEERSSSLPEVIVTEESTKSTEITCPPKDSNILTIQPLSRKRPSNFGREETELSPTMSVTSMGSNVSCSSSVTNSSNAARKRRLSQGSTSDFGCYMSANNHKGLKT